MTPLLEIEGLHSGYRQMEVLHGISLHVGRGEIVALVGANGAGKSTLLNTIAGVVATRAGRIDFDGRPIQNLPTQDIVKRGLQLVPERRQLFGAMTVEENLLIGAYSRAGTTSREQLARDMNELFGLFPRLSERRRQRAQSLSGGEQQMTAIARGLMAKPRLLLLDEPSLGLAPLIVEQIVEQIVHLRESGCTILLVEQNARVALSVADRAYVVETGKIGMSGKASDLMADATVQDAYLGGSGGNPNSMEERIRSRAMAASGNARI
jgi:branched-chain amino acid transport system ATP-binding protein